MGRRTGGPRYGRRLIVLPPRLQRAAARQLAAELTGGLYLERYDARTGHAQVSPRFRMVQVAI